MIELFGLVFGGASRLVQHWLELKDKQAEREHEANMYDKQLALADKRFEHDSSLRKMDVQAAETQAEWQAMTVAIESQAKEASNAGGWVAKFSALMRPLLTFYHAIVIYSVVKVAIFYIAMNSNVTWTTAIVQIYGDFDRALLGSMVSFWFADRSLRNWGRK